MEDWTEANLIKLSVKKLKSLARESNVNPNSKKAELVKALLTNNVTDTVIQNEMNNPNEAQSSRRMTRSRVSIWPTSDGSSDFVKETKSKMEGNLNSEVKESVNEKRIRRKQEKTVENIDMCNTVQMFPLVSSIQLASKPLLEITNKEMINEYYKQGECKAVATSKRTKRNKEKSKNIEDILPSTDKGVNPNQSVEVEKIKVIEQTKSVSVSVDKSESGKPKRGKKKKPESPVENERQAENATVQHKSPEISDDTASDGPSCVTHLQEESPVKQEFNDISNSKNIKGRNTPISEKSKQNLQGGSHYQNKASKTRKKKCSKGDKDGSLSEKPQNVEYSIIQGTSKVIDKLPETSVSEIVQQKTINSNNSETKPYHLKKRKRRNSSPKENNNIIEINISDSDEIKSKRKKSAQLNKTNVLSSTEVSVHDKLNMSKKIILQESSLENKRYKNINPTESAETSLNYSSSFQRSSRGNRSVPEIQNESTVVKENVNNSLIKSPTKVQNTTIEKSMDVKNISLQEGETGIQSVQAPIRSSTFILSDSVEETQEMPVPVRDSTLLLSETGGKGLQRKSLRFSPGSTLEKKSTSNQNAPKLGKSIGNRIMQNSNKKRTNEKSMNKDPGSALKKTIVKSTTPGSVFKKRPTSKMPDFKKIHLQLFNNMESLSENKKRQLDRAQGLLQSPIVPRCALLSPKGACPKSSPLRKVQDGKINSPLAPSPLAAKLKTPAPVRTQKASQKAIPVASTVNRFGFRKPLKKEEATSIIGKKLPSINLEKKKEQERNLLHGVRMNKRFMLQMQMRQTHKDKEK